MDFSAFYEGFILPWTMFALPGLAVVAVAALMIWLGTRARTDES